MSELCHTCYSKFFLKIEDKMFELIVILRSTAEKSPPFKGKTWKKLCCLFRMFSSILVRRWWHTDWLTDQRKGLYWCELDRKQSNLTFMAHFQNFYGIFTIKTIFFSHGAPPGPQWSAWNAIQRIQYQSSINSRNRWSFLYNCFLIELIFKI